MIDAFVPFIAGMDAATVLRLFQPFQQADSTVSRTHGGTGLGLSISKALVELWGGHIEVNSQLGELLAAEIHIYMYMYRSMHRCGHCVFVHLDGEARHIGQMRRDLQRADNAARHVLVV